MSFEMIDRVLERFDEIEPILQMVDYSKAREIAFKMAFDRHVELLKANWPGAIYGVRVKPIRELEREYMQTLNLIYAIDICEILDSIQEGEEHYYLNLRFTKRDGRVHVEDVGWSWIDEAAGKRGEER